MQQKNYFFEKFNFLWIEYQAIHVYKDFENKDIFINYQNIDNLSSKSDTFKESKTTLSFYYNLTKALEGNYKSNIC